MQAEDATVAELTDTRSEWFTSTNPDVLVNVVWERPLAYSGAIAAAHLAPPLARRLRLFGCACARMVWDMLSTDSQSAVLFSERHADGRATWGDVRASAVGMRYGPVAFQQQAANAAGWASAGRFGNPAGWEDPFVWNPVEAARVAAKALATRAAGSAPPGGNPVAVEWQEKWNAAFAAARVHQAELVRDIFPPPGYTPALERDWLTDNVRTLARYADDAGEYGVLPILADALQDAGCDDEYILGRCRAESGIHARGNWVVDLLLGRG